MSVQTTAFNTMMAGQQMQMQPQQQQQQYKRPIFDVSGGSGMDDDEEEEEEATSLRPPPLPTVPPQAGPPTISLGVLLDFAVQQTFHEVTVLAELLPKKQDNDRKMTLVRFAHSTRLLFVKLLAVVKWLKSSKKFNACTAICYLLDQQAQYFIHTADELVKLSREELVLARLPAFQVASAVDVLAVGTFPRLPLCIKSRFIPEPKITSREQASTLQRLNQVLYYRVSKVAGQLSPRINEIKIRNGMAKLVVEGEFEVTLTVLGEAESLNWHLLRINMLVEDYQIGYGMPLVHPQQMQMIHDVLQSRMYESDQPLVELYTYMHSFAQMLQLDVLHCQALQMAAGRLRGKISIERYDPKERLLSIGYWLQHIPGKKAVGQQSKYQPTYRLVIYGDPENHNAPLRVRHLPAGPSFVNVDLRSGRLSLIELLSYALAHRCCDRLLRVRKRLEAANQDAHIEQSGSAAPSLRYVILADVASAAPNPAENETLIISVNMFSGQLLCSLPALGDRPEIRSLEAALYGSSHSAASIRAMIYRLNVLLIIERYHRAVSCLNVRIMAEAQMAPMLEKVPSLPADRLCLQFIKEDSYYLVVAFIPEEELVVRTQLFLLESTPAFSVTALVDENSCLSPEMLRYMDKDVNDNSKYSPPRKRSEFAPWERPLTSAVAGVDDRIAFSRLCAELARRGFRFEPVRTEDRVGGLVLHITDVSRAIDVECRAFFEALTRCCIRQDSKGKVCWPFECALVNSPVVSDFLPHKKGSKTNTMIMEMASTTPAQAAAMGTESISSTVVDRLSIFCHIYDLVVRFAALYDEHYKQFCSVLHFTYHKLVLAYGANRDQLVIVNYKTKQQQPGQGPRLFLCFGQCPPAEVHDATRSTDLVGDGYGETQWNPHTIMTHLLTDRLNQEWDLSELVHYLINTVSPLSALANFYRFRFQSVKVYAQLMGYDLPFPLQLKSVLIPVNETTIRLVYAHIHLEFTLMEDSKVMVRDVSRRGPQAAGLHRFYRMISGGTAQVVEEESVQSAVTQGGAAGFGARNIGGLLAPTNGGRPGASPQGGPASFPARLELPQGMSPATAARLSRSVPPPVGGASAPSPAVGRGNETDSEMAASSAPIVIDHATHHKACTFVDSGYGSMLGTLRAAPLDDYLHAVVFLKRLGNALEAYRITPTAPTALLISFQEYSYGPDWVRASVLSANPSTPPKGFSPCTVIFHFHIDQEAMKLRVKIDYVGDYIPADSDVSIAEKYFERCVAHMNNELAVISFMNLCRITPHNAFASIAQIMNAQMDPSPHSYYALSFVLSQISKGKTSKFACGIILESTNTALAFTLCFRPNNRKDRLTEKHSVRIIYNMLGNHLRHSSGGASGGGSGGGGASGSGVGGGAGQGQAAGDDDVAQLLAAVSAEAQRTGECPIWMGVSRLLDKLSQGHVASMPASVGMPLSVGMPGSITNPGSMTNPGSNASQRQ